MAEYIDRDAVLDAIEGINWYKYNDEGRLTQGGTSHDKMFLPYSAVEGAIKSIPAADVRPVVRGRWEEDCAGAAVCSVCSEYAFETSTHHLCGWFPNYCPNCGADMREES